MNNEQLNAGDQFVQLQNIAYIKQFLRKGSIKVMMIVSFISAFLVGYLFLSVNNILDFLRKLSYTSGFDLNMDKFNAAINIFTGLFSVIGIVVTILNLILPITLLIIIIRAHNDNPSVVPSGAITFLHILSIIQFIFMIVSCVIMVISSIFLIIASDSRGNLASVIASSISNVFSYFITCLYYFFQTKFLGSVKNSAKGGNLISTGATGFGVYSVIYSISYGIGAVILLVLFIIAMSLSSSSNQMLPNELEVLFSSGMISSILTYLGICIAISVLSTIYQIAASVTAFGYKNTVTEAVRASFAAQANNPYNRANATINSPFRTYGGNNAYTNYNYSNSGSNGQQNYTNQQNIIDSNNNETKQNTDDLIYK